VSDPPDRGRLNTEEWSYLDEVASRFEEACRRGATPADPEEFLPPAGSRSRPFVLTELIKIHLEAGWRTGHGMTVESYLERFPELGPPDQPPVELLVEEYRVRHTHGDRPAVADYQRRFPLVAEEFARAVRASSDRMETYATRDGVTRRPRGPDAVTTAGPHAKGPAAAREGGVPAGAGYLLFNLIGSGQFGEVFYAEAPGGHPAAVKRSFRTLDHESSQRDLAALELLRKLTHPFLLEMHASWVHEGRLYIAMQLADESLADRFAQCKGAGLPGIPRDELIDFFAEVAEALDYLHGQHILHRDIKPGNLLRHKGHAKVADFGLARLLEADHAGVTFCGTPMFIAPEVWESKGSFQSDQYSLVCTYVEMRLGRPPFPGKNLFELAQQHREEPPDLEGIPEPERTAVAKALAKRPEDRYPSCRAFLRAVREAAAPPPPPSGRLGPGLASVIAVPVVCAIFAALVYSLSGSKPPADAAEAVYVPPNCEKAEGPNEAVKSEGRLFWKRVVLRRMGADPVELVLVHPTHAGDPPTFYIMRDKVWRDLYLAATRDAQMQQLLADARKVDPDSVQSTADIEANWAELKGEDPKDPPGRLPATGLTVTEAYCFTKWLAGEIGNLPTAQQWDKAGGRFDGKKRPCADDWEPGTGGVAINSKGPRAVGAADKDYGVFGCRDMSGNGLELTRNLDIPTDHQFVPIGRKAERDGDDVRLRGRKWEMTDPLEFPTDLDTDVRAGSWPYNARNLDTGFRVVLELPAR
jgi:serine/threonine protein kinase